ncbi:hypothetical protein BDN70DRAFT_889660 [Pholiota conissans]|uniref:Protein kinase domain-containing protein n=1 Tax=Pholiota conissans TaxID=109636 RepID=A0A9P5ZFZ0_9AGAR|nr:hypothetical protein BDN70DRAFT_889660 [Pholiota conissans]
MLASTPTKSYVHRNAPGVDVSPNFNIHHCTPPQSHNRYDSPMLSPSPLRKRPLFPMSKNSYANDSDDQSTFPFKPSALAHLNNPLLTTTKPQPITADDEEGAIFLSSTFSESHSASPFFNPSSSTPLLTPVKQSHRISSRPALAPVSTNTTRFGAVTPAADLVTTSRVGVGTKRKSTPNITPLRPSHHTPLRVTSEKSQDTLVAFDRLAPLPAPKFTARTPQTKAETDAYLKRQTATLTRLRLNDHHPQPDGFHDFDETTNDSGCEMDDGYESDHALFLNKTRSKPKHLIFESPFPKGKDKEEVAEAVSPGGHITKRRARSRPLSAELLEKSYKVPQKSPIKSSIPSRVGTRPRHSGPVLFPSTVHRGGMSPSSGSSSSSDTGSPRRPRHRTSGGSNFTRPNAAMYPPRPPLSRIDSISAATLFFGPAIPVAKQSIQTPGPATRSRTSSTALSASKAPIQRLQSQRPNLANRHSYAGPESDLKAWNTVQTRDIPSPGSSPFGAAVDEGLGHTSVEMDDEDLFFAGDDSFKLNLIANTPSPPAKTALPMKYNPREFALGSDEEEMQSTGSSSTGDFRHAMPKASTSVSSICSDEGLVTPGVAPEGFSGWPTAKVFVKGADDSHTHTHPYGGKVIDVDEFIMKTLSDASKASNMPKKAPGTPVKKTRMSYFGNERPWQSAVASKVGLKDDCDFKKVPRKSLPAAFSGMNSKAAKLTIERQNSTDTEEEEEYSPSMRRDNKYTGLGLGQPPPPGAKNGAPLVRNRWLMRRSSSGAFSSGSDQTSVTNTPTRGKGIDWQLPKPRIPLHLPFSGDEPNKIWSRSTSGSSNSSVTTLNSPTDYRRKSLVDTTVGARHLPSRREMVARRLSDSFAEDEQPGRFDRDFEEIEEVGSGEFGKVIKVQNKTSDALYAIKKSKQFEGAKHRLRLHEEVSILKHLSQAAKSRYVDGRHPNVLAYIDSWEENEALYICTELCESGNLARFLWEYGRVFPRLDEARVWKIVVDLSNGLRFIHDSGVIHLDLKPSNVFVTKEGQFKIGDFGMASLWPRPSFVDTASGASASALGGVQLGGSGEGGGGFEREGDKLYLAPEVLQGRYGKAADVFSFGMTILETASNVVVPDQGEGWQRLRREDFSQVDLEEDSPELADLVWSMMRTEPTARLTIGQVCAHPVVRRAREAMERMRDVLKSQGKSMWGASPLASVPHGFLEDILDRGEGAMDTSL